MNGTRITGIKACERKAFKNYFFQSVSRLSACRLDSEIILLPVLLSAEALGEAQQLYSWKLSVLVLSSHRTFNLYFLHLTLSKEQEFAF